MYQSTFPIISHTANINAKSPSVTPDNKAVAAADVEKMQSS